MHEVTTVMTGPVPGQVAGREDALAFYRRLCSTVSIVTAVGARGRVGTTASTLTSVSLSPPLVLVCLASGGRTVETIVETGAFAATVLRADQDWCGRKFAAPIEHEDRFAGVRTELIDGQHVLVPRSAYAVCELVSAEEAGDHTVVIGRMSSSGVADGHPLAWHDSSFRTLAS